MKPWDSARALQVCGENPDKFILGELNLISVEFVLILERHILAFAQ